MSKKIPDGFVDWMNGYCEGFEDMPDGAWAECCQEAVKVYNEEHKTNIDPHDGWMFWLKKTSMVGP